MTIEATNEQREAAGVLASQLSGSCASITGATIDSSPQLKSMDIGDVEVLVCEVGELFICDMCGWWCENSEMSIVDDEQRCEQCADD